MKSGMEWVEESQFPWLVKISRGSLKRMRCVKEPAKWQNTVGEFIIIFLLLCMYNDCPHCRTQDAVHNYITPDSTETGACILHFTWKDFLLTGSLSLRFYPELSVRLFSLMNLHFVAIVSVIDTHYNTPADLWSICDRMLTVSSVKGGCCVMCVPNDMNMHISVKSVPGS